MNSWIGHHESATSSLTVLGCVASIVWILFVGWAKTVIARPTRKPKR